MKTLLIVFFLSLASQVFAQHSWVYYGETDNTHHYYDSAFAKGIPGDSIIYVIEREEPFPDSLEVVRSRLVKHNAHGYEKYASGITLIKLNSAAQTYQILIEKDYDDQEQQLYFKSFAPENAEVIDIRPNSIIALLIKKVCN